MRTISLLLGASLAGALLVPLAGADDALLGDQLGTIHFEAGGLPAAQPHVVRGVKLLHHMMYPEADHEFAAALAADPDCALAWWGRAMTIIHPLWPDAPTAAENQKGAEYIRHGLALAAATPRERAYLETLDVYFGPAAAADYPTRLKELDRAWSALAERYPDDLDALAFSALYHLAPARFMPKDRSQRAQLDAAARLQTILAKIPNHPGAQHYKIHAYDFPLLADRALEVCDTYGGIAPDVPHALHMPTHIYTRRGLWDKSIEFNLRSAEAARQLAAAAGALNGHLPHALDYLAYAYLQTGRYREADAIRRQLADFNGPYSPVQPAAMAFAFAAIPARCALERQAWAEAALLPLHQPAAFSWGTSTRHCDSIVRFARAIGAARAGKVDAARAELVELEQLQRDLQAGKGVAYWIAQADTQVLAARAWIEFAAGNKDEAVSLMRKSAEIEATSDKEAVTPGEVLPAGDLLGDLYLELGRPAEALAAYEGVLLASPNRFNTLYGAGLAAERAGDPAKAQKHYEQLLAVAAHADAGNPRLDAARRFLATLRTAKGEQVARLPLVAAQYQ